MKHEFKVGDWVYCPELGTKPLRLESKAGKKDFHTVQISNRFRKKLLCSDGTYNDDYQLPCIFPATEKNRQLLSELHGVEFEKAPLRGSELTEKLLGCGWDSVLCWVSGVSDEDARNNKHNKIVRYFIANDNFPFKSCVGWTGESFAVPFDPRTGKELTEEVLGG